MWFLEGLFVVVVCAVLVWAVIPDEVRGLQSFLTNAKTRSNRPTRHTPQNKPSAGHRSKGRGERKL